MNPDDAPQPPPRPAGAGLFEALGRKLDQRPEVQAAHEALREARERFEQAEQSYQEVRAQAAASAERVRGRNVGDLLDSVLGWVRKHPGPGVAAALATGIVLGRIFRRR